MSDRRRVLVVGDVMRDIVVVPEGAMRRGSDINATIRIVPGGSAANQAKWLAHQQVDVTLVARVGAADGAVLTAEFDRAGVNAVLAEDLDLATGTLINLSEPGGERSFFTDRGANQKLSIDDVPETALTQAELLLLSGYMLFAETGRRTAMALVGAARNAGVKVAVDAASAGYISDVGASRFLEWTAGSDLLFANAEEATLLSGEDSTDRQVQRLLRTYAQVIIKLGAEGAVVAGPDGVIHRAEAAAATCVDSTGAGDAFAAGFLSAALGGGMPNDCLIAGNRAAALAVSQIGGAPKDRPLRAE